MRPRQAAILTAARRPRIPSHYYPHCQTTTTRLGFSPSPRRGAGLYASPRGSVKRFVELISGSARAPLQAPSTADRSPRRGPVTWGRITFPSRPHGPVVSRSRGCRAGRCLPIEDSERAPEQPAVRPPSGPLSPASGKF